MTGRENSREQRPRTALGEVLAEAEDAERRTTGSGRRAAGSGGRRHRDGEAGEAVTPNADAQERASGGG